jgi:hypothetical protein
MLSTSVEGAPGVTIDPLAPLGGGQYRDRLVTVVNGAAELPATDVKVAATISFELRRRGWQLVVRHRVPDSSIDDSLTTLINEELFVPGWVSGNAVFESIFTGVVVTSRPDPLDAWVLFYTNTMRHYVDAALDDSSAEPTAQQALSSFIEIHREVDALVPRGASVLELGACFGFLSLFLSRLPTREVIASDISVGTMRLLSAVAGRLHVAVDTLVADAARIPRPDSSVDVVLMIHLLEHLEPRHGRQAVAEALRVASRRVVIAVPYEQEATAAYGHVRTINETDLRALGEQAAGWDFSVHEKHGGWLVLDRR